MGLTAVGREIDKDLLTPIGQVIRLVEGKENGGFPDGTKGWKA